MCVCFLPTNHIQCCRGEALEKCHLQPDYAILLKHTNIIIIIIFNFYIALITNVTKRFTNILLPRSLDSVLAHTHYCVHNLHSLGSIPNMNFNCTKIDAIVGVPEESLVQSSNEVVVPRGSTSIKRRATRIQREMPPTETPWIKTALPGC